MVVGLLVLQQVLIPLSGARAQIDPCSPVPIPGLCRPQPDPDPEPSPEPKPKPKPGDDGKNGGGRDDGKNGGGGGRGTGRLSPRDRVGPGESPAFLLGGPQNTADLIETLTQLTKYGVPLQKSLASVVGPFPVAGLAWWTDDWHACRDGCTRFHEGLDIFAESGTPLVAAADGIVTQKGKGRLSGLHVEIEDVDGTQYFYAHLSDWAEGLRLGQRVRTGQVLGYVGNTGNAISTPPHVHFEYQPKGKPQPPKPIVDRWLRIAERRAEELVLRYAGEEPLALEDLDQFRLIRLFDLAGGGAELEPGSARLLILAGLQPAASSLELTRRTIDEMAWEIDWGEHIQAQLEELIEDYEEHASAHGSAGASAPFLAVLDEETLDREPQPAEVGD